MKQAVRVFILFGLIPFIFFSCPNLVIPGDETYAVNYDTNGATAGIAPVDENAYKRGDSVQVLGAEGIFRTGYAFSGWNSQPDGKGVTFPEAQTFIMGAADVTLYAKWSLVPTYGVSYVPNGADSGNPPVDPRLYKTGEELTVLGPASLVRDGFAFVGWSNKSDGSGSTWMEGQTLTVGEGPVILYARWSDNPVYSVSYDDNGAFSGSLPSGPALYETGWTVTVLDNTGSLERPGYGFSGWNSAADGSGSSYSAGSTFPMGTSDVILYAAWTPNPTYQLSYDPNGASSGTAPGPFFYEEGQEVVILGNVNGLALDGYWFAGWNSVSDGSGTSFDPGALTAMPAAAATLYAQWSVIPLYTVTYLPNSADSGSAPEDLSLYNQGEEVTALDNSGGLLRAGYDFGGWNTAADGTGVSYGVGQSFAMGGADLDLYARWIPLYRVTYDRDEASSGTAPVDSALYAAGAQVTVLGNTGTLERAGYGFSGWNTASDGSGVTYAQGQTLTMGSSDLTLYAHWTADPLYLLSYAGNGATSGAVPLIPTEHPAGAALTIPGPGSLSRDGYSFAGWNTASDGSGTAYLEGSPFSMPAQANVLYAQWTGAETYALVYDGNLSTGGSAPGTPSYQAGALVTVMANTGNFTRSGYTFDGWNSAAGGTAAGGTPYAPGSSFTMPAGTATLYAQWAIIPTFSVNYNANGADNAGTGTLPTGASGLTEGAPYGVQYNIDWFKTGYSFGGWCPATDGNGPVYNGGDTLAMPAANLILYAVWTMNPTYSLSFVGNGADGGTAPATAYYAAGNSVTLPTNSFTRTNHSFNAWNTKADGTGDPYAQGATYAMPADDSIIYATWTPDTWPVGYNANGGTGSLPSGGLFAAGATVAVDFSAIPTPPAGSSFVGWNTASDGSGILYSTGTSFIMAAGPVTLYAEYSTNPTYSISYAANGATGGTVPVDLASYEAGSTATIQGQGSLLRTGYTFAAWNTASDGSGTDVSGSYAMPAADLVLYARWTANAYTLTYDLNGGTGTAPATENRLMAENFTLSSMALPTRTGYSCLGWCPDAGGIGPVYAQGASFSMPASNVTLYAAWQANPSYSLSYDGNGATGGTVPAAPIYREAGVTVTVLDNTGTLEKPGYAFSGWNTKTDGSGISYAAGALLTMPAANTILYARWIGVTHVLSYSANGGGWMSTPPAALDMAPGATHSIDLDDSDLSPPVGMGFIGWALDAGATGIIYQYGDPVTMGAADIVLYAAWKPLYELSYDLAGATGGPSGLVGSYLAGTDLTALNLDAGTTLPGHAFNGWLDTDGSTYSVKIPAGSTFTMPERAMTLAAEWLPETYTLSFDANGGTPTGSYTFPFSQSVSYFDFVSALDNGMCGLELTGMAFNGWNEADDGSLTHYDEGQSLTGFTGDMTLYAEWIPGYQVSYDANGATAGSLPWPSAETYPQGGTYYVQPNSGGLERTGYNFLCWNSASDGMGMDHYPSIPYSPLSADLPLYAKWTAIDYFVGYDPNGADSGSAPADPANPYFYEESLTILGNVGAPAMVKAGHDFSGWNTRADGTGAFLGVDAVLPMPLDGLFLYAQWTPQPYSLSYDANTGSGLVPVDATVYHIGDQAVVRSQSGLWRDGYLFAGWNSQADGFGTPYPVESFYTFADHSQTLYAMWSPAPSYGVIYQDPTGFWGAMPTDSNIYHAGDIVAIKEFADDMVTPLYQALVRPGYDFMGWNTATESSGYNGTAIMVDNLYISGLDPTLTMGSSDIILYAYWLPMHYGISFESNGGYTYGYPDGTDYDYDDDATIPDNWNPLATPVPTPYFNREGYSFTGWDIVPSPTPSTPPLYPAAALPTMVPMADLVALTSPPPNQSVRLYAQWSANSYTLSYNGNGATVGDPPSGASYFTNDSVVTQSNIGGSPSFIPLSRPGYTFTGWCLDDPTGSTGMRFDQSGGQSFPMPGHDATLYAMWEENWYQVTYRNDYADSGYPPSDPSSYRIYDWVNVMGVGGMQRAGWTFAGWSLFSDGTGTIYGPSWTTQIQMGDMNIEFYPVWSQNQYNVSYALQSSLVPPATGTMPSDGAFYNYGSPVPLADMPADLSRSGYTAIGWCADENGWGPVYAWGSTYTMGQSNATFYPAWQINPSYGITYYNNFNGGSLGYGPYASGSNVSLQSGWTFTHPAGKEFMSWNTAADGSGASYASEATLIMPSYPLSLYAIWGTRVNYDANGGFGAVPTDSYLHKDGEYVTIQSPPYPESFGKEGYSFDGWAPNADGSGGTKYPGQSIQIGTAPFTAPLTLYARWKSALGVRSETSGNGTTVFTDVATDSNGNAYAVGYVEGFGTVSFDGAISVTGRSSGRTSLIVKYAPDGTPLWARGLNSAIGESAFNAVAVDGSGMVYAVGYQTGSGDFKYEDGGLNLTVSSMGLNKNSVIIQYSSNGSIYAGRSMDSAPDDCEFLGIAANGGSTVYAVGYQNGGSYWYNGDTMTRSGPYGSGSNSVIVAYSTSGLNVSQVKTITSSGGPTRFNDACLNSGYLYVVGSQDGMTTFNYDGLSLPGKTGYVNAVLVKYSSGLGAQYATSVLSAVYGTEFTSVAADSSGYVYAAGYQLSADAVNWGPGNLYGTSWYENQVLVKYTPVLGAQWARVSSGPSTDAYARYDDVAVDMKDNVYAVGYQETSGAYTYDSFITNGPGTTKNISLVKYDSSGAVLWARTMVAGSTSMDSRFYGVAVDGGGNVLAAGYQYDPTQGNPFVYGIDVSSTAVGLVTSNAVIVKYLP